MKPPVSLPRPLRSAGVLAFALQLASATPALAAVITVGPNETVTRIADAARLARDGDTVLIRAGTYRGEVAVWTQKSLTLRGIGGRPVLVAAGQAAENKAIWVIRGEQVSIDNIEFRGARVAAGHGAGIRFERGRLAVRDCVFEDNEHGILVANFEDMELSIRDSVFRQAARGGPLPAHLLYVGRIARFTLEGSRFEQGHGGHLVKSRARVNDIRYNLIADGAGGEASYELEFPEGGDATVVGNVIAQGPATGNPAVISYGAEHGRWPVNRLRLAHNTLINDGPAQGPFLRAWFERLPADARVISHNNLLVGPGGFVDDMPGEHRGNARLPAGALGADSAWRGPLLKLEPVAPEDDPALTPRAEFRFPAGTRPIDTPLRWAPGAFQTPLP